MRKIIVIVTFLFGFLTLARSNDQVTCTIEALAYENEMKYQDIINFINKEKLDIDEISYPDVYVFAYSWLNTPYRYGGNSKNGIDCSRFVMKMYNDVLGIPTNGTSREIFNKGNTIDKSQLQEGDLVFFRTRGNSVSHVGVYLQDNKFVHSSTSKGVVVSSLNEPYWQRTYYKSARFFEANPF
ncbi:MAG: C40 family peptidase [Chitinophagales bacterium]|nr:C40 family peptidase [Chitinophagales bacterium]MCZ2392939.1 C40 family peptidase [Chitinophagales bacterium]